MIRYLLLAACCLLPFAVTAQSEKNIVLRGTEVPQYMGDTLSFYTYRDLITHTRTPVQKVAVNENRSFEAIGQLADTGMVFTENTAYFAYFYATSGNTYTLYFPPSPEESKNDNTIFQEAIPVHIGVESSDTNDINRLVADEFVDHAPENKAYEVFKRYSHAWEKYKASPLNTGAYITGYFRDQPVYYHCTPYMELFNEVFYNFISFQLLKEKSAINSTINNRKGLLSLKQVLMRNVAFRDNAVTELAILNLIYRGVSDRLYSISGLYALAVEIAEESIYPEHRLIAGNILANTAATDKYMDE